MNQPIESTNLAKEAIELAASVIKHWKELAPEIPLERFIAQALVTWRGDAFLKAGWRDASSVCYLTVRLIGVTEISDGFTKKDAAV